MTNDEIEAEINRGIAFQAAKDLPSVISVYEALDKATLNNSMVLHMLAHSLWEAERYDEAYEAYKRLVALSPESESAAIGFFHCAWALGEYNEAMAELNRYQERDLVSDDFDQFLQWLDAWNNMRRNYDYKDMDRFRIIKCGFSMPGDKEPDEE